VKNFSSKGTAVSHRNAPSSGALIRPDYMAGKGNFVVKSQILACSYEKNKRLAAYTVFLNDSSVVISGRRCGKRG
jgi:hypothetical protein